MTYKNAIHPAHYVARPEAPDYLRLVAGGTRYRMMRLHDKMTAHNVNRPPSTSWASWREARRYGFNNWAGAHAAMSQGSNGEGFAKCPIWCTHCGEYFRDEQDAHDIVKSLPRGWFTDVDQNETAVGIVARLPHGRFLAGYRWTSNDERVWFGDVHDDQEDAARMADGHAERFADIAREADEHYSEAQNLICAIEEQEKRLIECIALRHKECMQYVRAEARNLIANIRANRSTLESDYADYV